jgi:hypothetical protein
MEIEEIAQIAQEQIDKENASDPLLKKALAIVEHFIKNHRVMCYGGTAINNLLPPEDRFYDTERDIPDYDFFSATPQIHALDLADQLTNEGFASVEVKPGVHLGTFKVFSDYIGIADISHLETPIFEALWKNSIEKNNIRYVPPNYLRMAVYLELSRPKGFVERWKKVYTRLQLLNKHYPMKCPSSKEEMDEIFLSDETKRLIEKLLIKDEAVLLGFNAFELQDVPSKATKAGQWRLPLDLLVTPEKRDTLVRGFESILSKKDKIEIKEYEAYGELLPTHVDIIDSRTKFLLVRMYETTACHSYHKTTDDLLVASIPTLLQFFLAMLYAPEHFLEDIPEERVICAAQHLVELANEKSHNRRYKLLTPITCLGKQKSLIDMRVEKSELYEKLSKNKSSPEYLQYFFTYTPTSLDKTQRSRVKKDLYRALKTHRKHR